MVLVCKAWSQIATEYLYEHIICGLSGLSDYSNLLTSLQASQRGQQLARLVIRVDISATCDQPYLQSAFLRFCPNLQSIYISTDFFCHPYLYSDGHRNLPIASISPQLLQTREYERFWSVMDQWRSLTICFDIPGPNGTIPIPPKDLPPPPVYFDGKVFTNLRHIVFTSRGHRKYSIRNLIHWPLPSLTHLTISSYTPGVEKTYEDVLHMLQSSQLGLQLKFFALLVHRTTSSHSTTMSGSLELLKSMPNLEEVVLPFFWVSALPPIMTIALPKVHTVGMENDRLGYTLATTMENAFAFYAEICCRLFPNMRKMRTTSTMSRYTVAFFLARKVGPMVHLKRAAAVLKDHGIKFEDCVGCDITHLLSKKSKETILCR